MCACVVGKEKGSVCLLAFCSCVPAVLILRRRSRLPAVKDVEQNDAFIACERVSRSTLSVTCHLLPIVAPLFSQQSPYFFPCFAGAERLRPGLRPTRRAEAEPCGALSASKPPPKKLTVVTVCSASRECMGARASPKCSYRGGQGVLAQIVPLHLLSARRYLALSLPFPLRTPLPLRACRRAKRASRVCPAGFGIV